MDFTYKSLTGRKVANEMPAEGRRAEEWSLRGDSGELESLPMGQPQQQ